MLGMFEAAPAFGWKSQTLRSSETHLKVASADLGLEYVEQAVAAKTAGLEVTAVAAEGFVRVEADYQTCVVTVGLSDQAVGIELHFAAGFDS